MRLSPQSPDGITCLCVFFLLFGLLMLLSPPSPTQYIFHMPMARYSLYVQKVPLKAVLNVFFSLHHSNCLYLMNTKWYLLQPKSCANWIKIQFCSSCGVAFNEMLGLIDNLGTNVCLLSCCLHFVLYATTPSWSSGYTHGKIVFLSSQHHFQAIINTISHSLNKGSLNDAKKKIRPTRPLKHPVSVSSTPDAVDHRLHRS